MTQDNPRFLTVKEQACFFLLDQNICSLPVCPTSLIKKMGLSIVSYTSLCEMLNENGSHHTVADLIEACGSKDGFTVKSHGCFCIAFNDTQKNNNRINFTLMHEIGHIILGHFDVQNEAEKEKNYKAFEEEADLFASEVLAPAAVIRACSIQTPELLKAASGLSITAARKRLSDLMWQRPCETDEKILKAFGSYIEVVTRRNNLKAVFA